MLRRRRRSAPLSWRGRWRRWMRAGAPCRPSWRRAAGAPPSCAAAVRRLPRAPSARAHRHAHHGAQKPCLRTHAATGKRAFCSPADTPAFGSRGCVGRPAAGLPSSRSPLYCWRCWGAARNQGTPSVPSACAARLGACDTYSAACLLRHHKCMPLANSACPCCVGQKIQCVYPEGREAEVLVIRRANAGLLVALPHTTAPSRRYSLSPGAGDSCLVVWLASVVSIFWGRSYSAPLFLHSLFIRDTGQKAEVLQVACAGEGFHGMGSCGHHRCGGLGATPCSQRRELDVNPCVQEQAIWRRGGPSFA